MSLKMMIQNAYRTQLVRKAFVALGCGVLLSLSLSRLLPLMSSGEIPMLRMSAGPRLTRRHEVATYLAKEAARNGVLIDVVTNRGTGDTLEQIKDRKLDMAIVSSGVSLPDDDNIMVLGAIQVEALHVLVRKELADASRFGERIRGKRVNVGIPGSTEYLLAHDFLKFANLKPSSPSQPGDFIATGLSKTELIERAQAIRRATGPARDALIAELPDCVIMLDSMPAIAAQHLIQAADYELVPQPATRAYIADSLQDSRAQTTVLLREFLEPTSILAKSYFSTEGHPEKDCETIGVRLLVVARKDLPPEVIRPIMRTLYEGEFARRIHTKSPRELATTFEIHSAALAYLDRDKPLPINDVVRWIKDGFSLFGAFSALGLSLYGLVWRKKTRKPSDYYDAIRRIHLLAQGAEVDATESIQTDDLPAYLDDRLQKLRLELIEDICEGRIRGDQVITNILTLIKEARMNLHRGLHVVATPGTEPHEIEELKRRVA